MKQSFYSDEQIIKTIRKNDSDGCNDVLQIIYKLYYPVIQKFIISNNGNDSEARDIFQDTIVTFYEQAKEENFNLTCSIKTYLYSISRNLWLKRLNKLKKYDKSVEDFDVYITIENEENNFLQNPDSSEILLELIETLDEKCKEILTYYYFDRIKMKDIKTKMKLGSEQSAKNKKYKCMKHLMELVKNNKNLTLILKDGY